VEFLPSKEPPANRVSPAGIQDYVSRVVPAPGNPVSTGSIASRVWRNRLGLALWAPWERAAAVAIFSLGNKTLRLKNPIVNLKPPPQHFVKLQVQKAHPQRNCGTIFLCSK
jgi:hypothetical protein